MTSKLSILMFAMLFANSASADCEICTDDVATETLSQPILMWTYLVESKGCRIETLKLQDKMGGSFHNTESIFFTYIVDHGLASVGNLHTAAICFKGETGVVKCNLDLERAVK